MHVKRRSIHIWLYQTIVLVLMALLAACGGGRQPTAPLLSENGYLLTVPVAGSDSRESVAQRYGGEVIAWLEDKAILKLSSQATAALSERGVSLQNITLQPNPTVQSPATALGFNSWAGGFNSWAGGFNSWAGGWNSWAGGTSTIPALPSENRFQFMLTKVPQAQALSRNFGQGIKVAVIDTGIDLNHPQFVGRLAPASEHYDFVSNDAIPQEVAGSMYGHGTGVASLILQVAPRATILPIRVLNGDGVGNTADVISAIQRAINMNAQIINLSLGTTENNSALQTIINSATSQGRYVIASAGNTGDSNITFPAAWAKSGTNQKFLLSVGSVSSALTMSLFSCSGTALEFLAPGALIAGAYPDNRFAYYTGTSFAAPQVSGALALAMSDTNWANWGHQETFLFDTATPIGSYTTYALVNVVGLLQRAPDVVRRNALFIHGGSSPNTSDNLLIARIQSLGYVVTTREAKLATTADATGRNLVVISATASAGDIGTKFTSVAVPVVIWRADAFGNMAMTSGSGTTDKQTQVSLVNGSHPLSAGLPASTSQTIYTAGEWISWGTPASGAVVISRLSGSSTQTTLFGYDTGSQMVGRTAPARRVGFFLRDNQASRLSSTGWNLFEAAITWAVSGN
jgi:subtilisin family serine protease